MLLYTCYIHSHTYLLPPHTLSLLLLCMLKGCVDAVCLLYVMPSLDSQIPRIVWLSHCLSGTNDGQKYIVRHHCCLRYHISQGCSSSVFNSSRHQSGVSLLRQQKVPTSQQRRFLSSTGSNWRTSTSSMALRCPRKVPSCFAVDLGLESRR